MKIFDKITLIKKTIKEIKNTSQNAKNENVLEAKIKELNIEILKLKEGISENVEELERILEENARS